MKREPDICKYRKVASSNTSRLEAHAGFFILLVKGIFDPYVLYKKSISLLVTLVKTHDYTVCWKLCWKLKISLHITKYVVVFHRKNAPLTEFRFLWGENRHYRAFFILCIVSFWKLVSWNFPRVTTTTFLEYKFQKPMWNVVDVIKGGLISVFSRWLQSPKKCVKSYP